MQHNLDYPGQQIQNQLEEVKVILRNVPKSIQIKNMHHFGAWSKSFIIGVLACFVITAGSVGVALHFNQRNNRLNSEAYNFWLVRALYPEVSKIIEFKLAKDPKGFTEMAEREMARQK